MHGIHLIEAFANLGFASACNLGASVARGEYLMLLNDDAVVAPGWLEWLVSTADSNPRAGAVGSVVLFPDGRIQEAGSVIWADGSTMPVGRDLPGESRSWHFVRKVDYVSACSLMVRRRAWEEVGGFDTEYYPAYYEDVDLCLALRERDYSVLLEPRSRVWHHESASSDTRFKQFLFSRNQSRIRQKWADALSFQEPPQPWSDAALSRAVSRARGAIGRILVVDDRIPNPSIGAGFGRMHVAVTELARAGYAVTFCPTAGVASAVPDSLISAGIEICETDIRSHVTCPWVLYDVVIVSRPHNFERFAKIVRTAQPQALLVYDCEALFWRRMERQAGIALDDAERRNLQQAAQVMRTLEERIVVDADLAVTVSTEEAELLAAIEGSCPLKSLLPSEPSVAFGTQGFQERVGVAFVAGWLAGSNSPNADGLRWFVSEVLPLLRGPLPWVRVRVTGANPPADLLALAGP